MKLHLTSGNHRTKWPIAALILLDGLFFGFSDPAKVPPVLLIVGFGLFVASLYLLVSLLLKMARWYGISFGRHRKRAAAVVTGVAAGTVALQSMGQLSPRDVLVLLPFACLTYLYTSYGKNAAQA